MQRDGVFFGTRATVTERYRSRYLPGQRLYLGNERPERRAHVVVGFNDPERPILKRFPVPLDDPEPDETPEPVEGA